MKKLLPAKLLYLALLAIAFSVSSCEKMAGHSIVPTTTTGTTTGGTFGTATGTVTFTIDKVGSYSWTLPSHFIGFGTTPTTGTYAFSSTPSTLITSGPSDVNQFLTNSFTLSFAGTTAGTYPMLTVGSGITIAGTTYSGGSTETVTVTSENVTITSTSLGTVKGSAKGTFTGQMTNLTTLALVNVSGTFDVAL